MLTSICYLSTKFKGQAGTHQFSFPTNPVFVKVYLDLPTFHEKTKIWENRIDKISYYSQWQQYILSISCATRLIKQTEQVIMEDKIMV